jgi:hypothetical protein
MPDEDEDIACAPDPEQVRVYIWRKRMFLRLGFGRGEAQLLAMGGLDWHEAEKLVNAGCPLDLAFDLLV